MRSCIKAMLALAVCTATCTPASGQTVFFDDFQNDTLLPHWNGLPPASSWEYNLNDDMLNVTGLFSPSHPKSPTNFAFLSAVQAFDPITDFQMDVRMGWGTAEGVARFHVMMLINQGIVARIGYRENDVAGEPGIFGSAAGTSSVTIPSPPPGIYDFRISRVGNLFDFYFDGNLFASLTSPYTGPVDGIGFFFSSPYPGSSGPFHVDNVHVQAIPSPSTILVVASLLISKSRRRR